MGVFLKRPCAGYLRVLGIIISREGQLSLFPVVHTIQRHKLLSMLKKFLTASSSRPRF